MVKFQRVVLTTVSDQPIVFPRWSGVDVRAWFVEQTRIADSQLLQSVTTDDRPPPYSLAPLTRLKAEDGAPVQSSDSLSASYTFTVTTLHDDLTALWSSQIVPHVVGSSIEIGDHRLLIKTVSTETITDTDLLQTYTLSPTQPLRSLQMRFTTPVTFRVSGAYFPFPSPSLVFGSLLDRWNSLSAAHLHPDARTFANECVRISHYQMQSRMVDTGESSFGRIIGGVGNVHFSIWRGDEYWYRVMHVLAVFSTWAGVGARTAIGLGNGHLAQPVTRA